jgi:hypothetical protein
MSSKERKHMQNFDRSSKGGGGSGQDWAEKLGFHSLLPLSPSIKKHIFKNDVH